MDRSVSPDNTSTNIFQTLSAIGAIDDLRVPLSKDFEKTFTELEKIPSEIHRVIISGVERDGMSLAVCIIYVQEVVSEILGQYLQIQQPRLENLAKKLHASLDKTLISLESLRHIERYIRGFCKKYPPKRIPDWGNITEEDGAKNHSNDIDTWDHNPEGYEESLEGDVGGKEKIALQRSLMAVGCYISHLNTLIPPGRDLHPHLTQKYLNDESARINILKNIANIIRDMLEWGNKCDPYRALCAHGEPLGPNVFEESNIDVFEIIKTWERVCKRLNIHKKKS